jgi:hypothetical protein
MIEWDGKDEYIRISIGNPNERPRSRIGVILKWL